MNLTEQGSLGRKDEEIVEVPIEEICSSSKFRLNYLEFNCEDCKYFEAEEDELARVKGECTNDSYCFGWPCDGIMEEYERIKKEKVPMPKEDYERIKKEGFEEVGYSFETRYLSLKRIED